MPSFIFIYRAGPDPVPTDQVRVNWEAWRKWNAALHSSWGIRTSAGKLVSATGGSDSDGVVRGAPMAWFDPLRTAIEVTRRCPNLEFGGTVEVLEELTSR